MRKKKFLKFSISIVLVVIVFLFAFLFPIFGSYTLHGKRFADHTDNYLCSIDWESYGDYEDYKYQFYHKNIAIWTATSWVITAEYTEENFNKQLDYINNNIQFMPEFLTDGWNGNKVRIQNKAKINSWIVKMVGGDVINEENDYPHHIEIIAYNTNDYKIAYMDFNDSDLDSIDSLELFIDDYINYRFK